MLDSLKNWLCCYVEFTSMIDTKLTEQLYKYWQAATIRRRSIEVDGRI